MGADDDARFFDIECIASEVASEKIVKLGRADLMREGFAQVGIFVEELEEARRFDHQADRVFRNSGCLDWGASKERCHAGDAARAQRLYELGVGVFRARSKNADPTLQNNKDGLWHLAWLNDHAANIGSNEFS